MREVLRHMVRQGAAIDARATRGSSPRLIGLLTGVAVALLMLSAAGTTLAAKPPSVPPQSLSVSAPTTGTAGTSQTVRITALINGATNAAYRGTIVLTSTDGRAILPGRYTFTAADKGVHAFSVQLKTAGPQVITAVDTTNAAITGSQSVSVVPAAPASFSLSGLSDSVAGTSQDLRLTVRDAYGNVATNYRGTVRGTSSDDQATFPASYTFTAADSGAHTFGVALKTAGQRAITYTDASNASLTATAGPVTVTPASAAGLVLDGLAHDAAGEVQSVSVTAFDPYGNVATGYRGTVAFTSNDSRAALPGAHAFTAGDAGSREFDVTLKTAGAHTVTATDTANAALTSTESATTTNGPAADLEVTTDVTDSFKGQPLVTAGQVFAVTVRVVDAYGNTALDYAGRISVGNTEKVLGQSLEKTYDLGPADAGTKRLDDYVLYEKAIYDTPATITAKDQANPALDADLDVQVLPGPAVRYSACPSPLSGSSNYQQVADPIGVNDALGINFRALDAYGNDATNQRPLIGEALPTGYQADAPVTTTDAQAEFGAQGAIARFVADRFSGQGSTIQVRFRTAGDQSYTVTDPINPALTISCQVRVRGPQAVHGTVALLDPSTRGDTRYVLPLTRYLPPSDSGFMIENLVGPTFGNVPVGTVAPLMATERDPSVAWELNPETSTGTVYRCTTDAPCLYSPLAFTYRIRDAYGNTADGSFSVIPWQGSLASGKIVYFDGAIGALTGSRLPLGSYTTGLVIGTRPGEASVRVGDSVLTLAMPTDSNLATGAQVELKVERPLVVGGTTPDCIPDVGKVCEKASFVEVSLVGHDEPDESNESEDPALTAVQTMGTDMCGFYTEEMTACPRADFAIFGPDGSGYPPIGHVGFQYHFQLLASSSSGEPVEIVRVEGRLPAGLTMDNSGLITGTPTTAETVSIQLQARGTLSGATSPINVFTILVSELPPN